MLFFSDDFSALFQEDSFHFLERVDSSSIDLIVADPPYFLSNGGISNRGGRIVSVDKGEWDKAIGFKPEEFYFRFLKEASRVMSPNATMWLFGTMHSIYLIGAMLSKFDFKILNNITWQKMNPSPNLSHRMFTHSTETILWVKKNQGQHYFNYNKMLYLNGGKQMTDVWTTPTIGLNEKRFGRHPTQKPLALMERILMASASPTAHILDPFVGSGTTIVAAKRLGFRAYGVDKNEKFLRIATKRIQDATNEKSSRIW